MRGTRSPSYPVTVPGRIIPAHAGNSVPGDTNLTTLTDHPRACGELDTAKKVGDVGGGSSPRMRGTRLRRSSRRGRTRIIPAHAGNSSSLGSHRGGFSDHPRACGELIGVCPAAYAAAGSSPRMRGTRGRAHAHDARGRIIPAHAGNSQRASSRGGWSPDHPRACGELHRAPVFHYVGSGSSPRMRGTRAACSAAVNLFWIIPAHAGNSVPVPGICGCTPDHPRACGELAPAMPSR